jgi:sugar phosphate isomerase/epimerase
MEAGISSYTFNWAFGVPGNRPDKPMTIFNLIEMAIALEAKVIQIADNISLEKFTDQELREFKFFADQAELKIEIGARCMTPERLKQYINIAHLLGAPILYFAIDGPDFEPSLNKINEIIKAVVPQLDTNGVTLCIENHERLLAHELLDIVQKAESNQVGICLDTVNSLGNGEGIETLIRLLAPITYNLHLKEYSIRRFTHKMGYLIEGAQLGKGMLPLAELITNVSPRCQSAILEQWAPPEKTLQETIQKEKRWAEESFLYLKSVLSTVKTG